MGNPEPESFIFEREIVGSGHIHDSIKNYLNVFKRQKSGGSRLILYQLNRHDFAYQTQYPGAPSRYQPMDRLAKRVHQALNWIQHVLIRYWASTYTPLTMHPPHLYPQDPISHGMDVIMKSANKSMTLTPFYTRGLEIVVLHMIVPQPYRFSPCFLT